MPTPTAPYVVDITLPSDQLVFGLLNHDNPQTKENQLPTITSDYLSLGKPTVLNNDPKGNTTLVATPTDKWYQFDRTTGTKILKYNRLSINYVLQNQLPYRFPDDSVKTVADVLKAIKAINNIGLTINELENVAINLIDDVVQSIKVKDDCLAWTGDITFSLYKVIPSLNNVIVNNSTLELEYTNDKTVANGFTYGYGINVQPKDVNTVVGITTGTIFNDGDTNWEFIPRGLPIGVTDKWECGSTSTSPFNCYMSSVKYNGPIKQGDANKPGFNSVVVIEPNRKYLTGIENNLTIWYNNPNINVISGEI